MLIEQFVLGPFVNNLFVIYSREGGEAILIDASFDIEKVIRFVKAKRLTLTKVILTHGHIDHIYGIAKIKKELNPVIILHRSDLWLYENINEQGEMFGFQTIPPPCPDTMLEDDTELEFNGVKFRIFSTPGHTPGSISISANIDGADVVFTGDTLFAGSIGRVDLWGGSMEAIERSIKTRLYTLTDGALVYPGHGEKTTIGREKKDNMFVRD